MNNLPPTLEVAQAYHEALPERIRTYLNNRGINDDVIDIHQLGWDSQRITIPIFDRDGRLLFFKLAKDPDDLSESPKMLAPAGASAELYGWERVRARPDRIIICEGEFDRLVLESNGFGAVTSTGGASVFRPEWAEDFRCIPGVYLCFDHDPAGRHGAQRVTQLIPHAKTIALPDEVGQGGDVTDYFTTCGRTREEFEQLMLAAQTLDVVPLSAATSSTPRTANPEVQELKSRVKIEQVIGRYVELQLSGRGYRGRCPFHDDQFPSLTVYSDTQSFYCFGCQAKGDVLTFLMRIENLRFPEALDRLRHL